MPIFDFTCQKCGHEFEELCMSASETPECTKCGAANATRNELSRFAAHTEAAPACGLPTSQKDSCGMAAAHGGGCGCCH